MEMVFFRDFVAPRNKRNDFPAALIERSLQFNMTVRKEERTAQTQNLKCFDPMLRGRRGNGSTSWNVSTVTKITRRKQKKENNVVSLFCSISQYCYFSITNQNNKKKISKRTNKITTYKWTISNVLTDKDAPFSQLLFSSETKPINVTSLFSLPVRQH